LWLRRGIVGIAVQWTGQARPPAKVGQPAQSSNNPQLVLVGEERRDVDEQRRVGSAADRGPVHTRPYDGDLADPVMPFDVPRRPTADRNDMAGGMQRPSLEPVQLCGAVGSEPGLQRERHVHQDTNVRGRDRHRLGAGQQPVHKCVSGPWPS